MKIRICFHARLASYSCRQLGIYAYVPISRVWASELDNPDDEVDAGDDGEDDEPEPEEDVDLLVQDVHPEDAEGVQGHERPGSAVLVERALGHAGEDPGHGVHAVLGVLPSELEHLAATQEKTKQTVNT